MKILSLCFAGLLAVGLPLASSSAQISITIAPPVLLAYDQPECPQDGYLWTPGYWANNDDGYYWVDGAWVEPPQVGYLWTPGYWGYNNGFYAFNEGYWGPTVGFYGGINYGYGYGGNGYYGGRWDGGHFRYNTAISHVNNSIHNTYVDKSVVNRGGRSRASFNGPGGTHSTPTAAQKAALKGPHVGPTGTQSSHIADAKSSRSHFTPAKAATTTGKTRTPSTASTAKTDRHTDAVHNSTTRSTGGQRTSHTNAVHNSSSGSHNTSRLTNSHAGTQIHGHGNTGGAIHNSAPKGGGHSQASAPVKKKK